MLSIQKYVNALFIFAGAVVGIVGHHYIQMAVGFFQLERKIGAGSQNIVYLEHGVAFFLALATFVILRRNLTTSNFSTDAIAELIKVSWPTQKDVTLGTIVVIVTVIVSGALLGFLDIGLQAFVSALIGA